jgi:predicted HTH transcriptional regulator
LNAIQNLLLSQESKTLKFKETMPAPQAIAKTACAFANGGGGSVIIGLGDRDKKIIQPEFRDHNGFFKITFYNPSSSD